MRRHRQLPGVGQRGNFAAFRQATAPTEVRHHDAGHAGLQIVLEAPFIAEGFAGADQRVAVFGVLLE